MQRTLFVFLSVIYWVFATTSVKAEEWGYCASFDLLYWKAWEKSAVLTNETSPVFDTSDFTTAPVRHAHFDWNPGFRLGIEVFSPCLPFVPSFDWTYYSTTAHQKQNTDSNDLTNVNNQLGMFPIWSLSEDTIPGDYVSDAELKWRIVLNLFDLKFALPQCCEEAFAWNPFVGIRGAVIRQNAHIEYSGGIFLYEILEGGVNVNGVDRIHMKNNFWGVGPRIGIEPRWEFFHHFSAVGELGISGLIGQFHIHQKEKFLGVTRFSHNKHPIALRCIGDLAAGLEWKTTLCHCYLVRCRLSWEYHIFFDQIKLKKDQFHLTPSNRNLSTQGITFSANINF